MFNWFKRGDSARKGVREDGKVHEDVSESCKAEGNAHFVEGRLDEAEHSYRRALEFDPRNAEVHNNLGLLLQAKGRAEDALEQFREALRIRPDLTVARYNLGFLLFGMGEAAQAEDCFLKVVEREATHFSTLYHLGILAAQSGRKENAEAWMRRAVQADPQHALARYNLGSLLEGSSPVEAEEAYRNAIRIQPDFALAHNNLGHLLERAARTEEAQECYRKAILYDPRSCEALVNLGRLLGTRTPGEAEACYRQAISLRPDFSVAHYNLANLLSEAGKNAEAEAFYRKALESKPDFQEALYNLGTLLLEEMRLYEARACFQKALELNPGFAEAWGALGNFYRETGEMEEACLCYRRAAELSPNDVAAGAKLVYSVYFHPGYNERAILAEAEKFSAAHRAEQARPVPALPVKKLRIGYVSPDFRNHCQKFFTIPLFANHDHERFEICGYSLVKKPDEIGRRLASHADLWRECFGKSDAELSAMISQDGIDILVDLTMHMNGARPMLFAKRPAPVQVSWLAYPGTTGIPGIDYRLTDPWLDPPGSGDEHRYAEESIRLAETYWCYDPQAPGMEVGPLPAFTEGHVTFGCLNHFCKVNETTLRGWGRILARVPDSRLILLSPPGAHREKVLERLSGEGVAGDRIEFMDRCSRTQYLQSFQRIDLCLDTLPSNGHTTSLDSYWMGVPVVTRVGETVMGRAGWSQLNNLGLPELAAFDESSFVEIAVGLANDLTALSELRKTLRSRMEASPLMDGKRFAASIEAAFREMWLRKGGKLEQG
ncbi:MAG: tetratricopeptide repeat protein [Burkholderiales bacterium]|nr:tetratricopeptide repeat protein [Burkholderiales bacterium]